MNLYKKQLAGAFIAKAPASGFCTINTSIHMLVCRIGCVWTYIRKGLCTITHIHTYVGVQPWLCLEIVPNQKCAGAVVAITSGT